MVIDNDFGNMQVLTVCTYGKYQVTAEVFEQFESCFETERSRHLDKKATANLTFKVLQVCDCRTFKTFLDAS